MRKLAKISALLAAMALALAFAGCKSDDDDDDTEYWISVETEDGETEYAKRYIKFESNSTATVYKYYDEGKVSDGKADTVGYHKEAEYTFKTSGDTLVVTAYTGYNYKNGKWTSSEQNMSQGSITLKISGSEMAVTMTYGGETETKGYTKAESKPAKPTYTSASM